MMAFIQTLGRWKEEIAVQSAVHLQLSVIAVLIAIGIGVPIGVLLIRFARFSRPVLYILGVFQTIPSLAMLGFLIPLVGIGVIPSIIVLVIYSLLVIVQNTVTGIQQIEDSILESATGIGMTKFQILYKVQIPLAVPVIIAGIRVATITCVGITTLVSAVGAGGLGVLIFRGIATVDTALILAGALPTAMLAILLDILLLYIERVITRKLKI